MLCRLRAFTDKHEGGVFLVGLAMGNKPSETMLASLKALLTTTHTLGDFLTLATLTVEMAKEEESFIS